MTITNGYTTLALWKARKNVTSTSAADDGVIETLIEGASRKFDILTGRTFYARTETHYYDAPEDGRTLEIMDDDLLSITTLTNGDGTAITSTYYALYPGNSSPKYKVVIKPSSAYLLTASPTDGEINAITIVGSWGYAATAPDDVQDAIEEMVTAEYQRRTGVNMEGTATVTGAGVVITPQGIPKAAWDVINYYKRRI
jgi:hypothetical protein